MNTGQAVSFKMKIVTPAEVWDTLLEVATDLEPFRRRGCVLETLVLTTGSIEFLVVYGKEILFTAKGTRTLRDEWHVRFTRTA